MWGAAGWLTGWTRRSDASSCSTCRCSARFGVRLSDRLIMAQLARRPGNGGFPILVESPVACHARVANRCPSSSVVLAQNPKRLQGPVARARLRLASARPLSGSVSRLRTNGMVPLRRACPSGQPPAGVCVSRGARGPLRCRFGPSSFSGVAAGGGRCWFRSSALYRVKERSPAEQSAPKGRGIRGPRPPAGTGRKNCLAGRDNWAVCAKQAARLCARPADSAASWWVQDPRRGRSGGPGALHAPAGPAPHRRGLGR
jgi:hypothetical protein